MIKQYLGNFPRLVKNGKIFSNYLVHGRDAIQVTDSIYHIIGMDTLLTFSQKAKVYTFKKYSIIKDGGRYYIFK